jgi:hypothetical protein
MEAENNKQLERRAFLGGAVAMGAFAAEGLSAAQDDIPMPRPTETRKGDMLYRSFGKTGKVVALISRAKEAALTGKYELFKTTSHFDSTAQNPKWLG